MKNIFDFFKKDNIGNPPWNYYFLQNLDEKEYPMYLKKIFEKETGETLPLKKENGKLVIDKKKCKTFNQKIQWIKLHGITDLMRTCTDKVAVRDYVRERIGGEYLKPVLQIIPKQVNPSPQPLSRREREQSLTNIEYTNAGEGTTLAPNSDVTTYFDKIDFDKLPNAFVMKCNHGCKWQYIIKNKEEYLKVPQLIEITKRQMTGWLEQEFTFFAGFELQYHNINPKILIEPLLRDDINTPCQEIHIYCFNGNPKYVIKLHNKNEITIWDEEFNITEDLFNFGEQKINCDVDKNIKLAFKLSKKLSEKFGFVRVDWMLYQNKLYFEELTFTPYSGFHNLANKRKNPSEWIRI